MKLNLQSLSDSFFIRNGICNAIFKKNTLYQWRRKYVRENKNSLCPTLTANMGMGGHEIEKENNSKEFAEILLEAINDFAIIEEDGSIQYTKFIKNIKLIGEERNNVDVKLHQCDHLYILGFGFDPINIEKIGLKSGIWNNACYLTNFNDNQRIKRIALNYLAKKGQENFYPPIISIKSIKDSFVSDFSLLENYEKYAIDHYIKREKESPYFAMKKYEQNIIINNNSKE